MNRDEIFQNLRSGNIEDVKKELVRYGEIIGDVQTEISTGFYRIYTIRYSDRAFIVDMHNGNTKSISVNGIRYT